MALDQVDLSLLPQGQPNYSFTGNLRRGLNQFAGNQDLALALLANSGYGPKRSFGQVLGQSALEAQKMGQQRSEDELMRQYRMAQIAQLQQSPQARGEYGQYQPGDYTPQSWAKFLQTKDPATLVRYVSPRQDTAKPFQFITRTYPDGSTQQGSFDARTGDFIPTGPVIPPGVKPEADAAGKARGEASGGQSAKAPAKASFDIALSNMRDSLIGTPQGGLFGVRGKIGTVTDKTQSDTFDSRIQQLSTELRTVFRIPGEGTLSDQEQRQYGVQLPSRDFNPETNAQILKDLEQRVAARIETPIGSGPTPPAAPATPAGKKRRYNPVTGKIE